MKKLIFLCLAPLLFASCDLLQGDGSADPNVDESKYLHSDNAMQAWVNGTEMQLSQAVGSYVQLLEIVSDNYYNQYSRSSNVFDQPMLLSTDDDVKDLQRWAATLRESADYGLLTVAKHDAKLSHEQKFTLDWIRAYSFILGGETFTGLPMQNGGDVKPWRELLEEARKELAATLEEAPVDSDRAFVETLLARACYRLGDRDEAMSHARAALNASPDFVKFVNYDGANNVNNIAQEALWDNWFQPLPRLDFLDPKYFKTSSTEERPVCIAKAEENYLILAEAEAVGGNDEAARTWLRQLLRLVNSRPTMRIIDANCEMYNSKSKPYPMSADYKVRASATDPYRSGLVQTRSNTTYVNVPIVSGTSVDKAMVDAAKGDNLLELIYLLRQEVFMAEGRRVADLGIRLPLCDTEAAHAPSTEAFTEAVIPPFIPKNGEMDNFDLDADSHTVTIHYNMNHVIVENKHSDYVVPFVK